MQVENKCYVTQRDLDSVFALIIKSKNTVKENYDIKVTQPVPRKREASGSAGLGKDGKSNRARVGNCWGNMR